MGVLVGGVPYCDLKSNQASPGINAHSGKVAPKTKSLPAMNIITRTPINAPSARRQFLRHVGLGAAFFSMPGAFAEQLMRTPAQTEGPFYPDHLPLDTDNDLLVVNDSLTPAVGEVTYLSGRILGPTGEPVRNAVVEIWQCDHSGVYLHSGSDNAAKRDRNFQGFGRFVTGSMGEYLFRTIKPVPYPGRTPHIHFKIKRTGHELLTTHCYIKGYAGNPRDGIWRDLGSAEKQAAVTVDFAPLPGAKAGELTAKFDVVLGVTPEM